MSMTPMAIRRRVLGMKYGKIMRAEQQTPEKPRRAQGFLFGCLSCLSFASLFCLMAFCFLPFSLSFLPPLSPIVLLL